MDLSAFEGFGKIPRLKRDMIITEKIDGTNAQVFITSTFEAQESTIRTEHVLSADFERDLVMFAGSRNRLLTVEKDNYGFARWVRENATGLFDLGPGRHFGEWWGSGIQRGYGLPKGEKRFSLFNASRWKGGSTEPTGLAELPNRLEPPSCCSVVPVLYYGPFNTLTATGCLNDLRIDGSYAAPGFMNPEGIVVYHTAAGVGFKATCKNDEKPKSQVR